MLKNPKSSNKAKPHVTFANFHGPDLTGLSPSDQEAVHFILEFIDKQSESKPNKLKFLKAVETLTNTVRLMPQDNLNKYIPKVVLASKIEALILEEPIAHLDSNVLQQAMLCIVSLSQVHPPFYVSQKLDLLSAALQKVFLLPPIGDNPDEKQKESKLLLVQTVHALDDMVHALVLHENNPDMPTLQKVLEIILPWLTNSKTIYEQVRAMRTISRLMRFICNFSKLSNMESFSISGKLMGTFGLFCVHRSFDISTWASEALHYLLKILLMQRGEKLDIEITLKNLQKNFHGDWFIIIQDLTMFFTKYLTPEERTDVIIVLLNTMVFKKSQESTSAASQILMMLMNQSLLEIGKVWEVVQFLCDNLNRVTDAQSLNVTKKFFNVLAQTYTDELILSLVNIDNQSHRGSHQHWGILSSFPKGYEVVMNILMQRLISREMCSDEEDDKPDSRVKISPLIATKAIHQLLLESTQRTELQTFYSSLFLALLFQLSFLVMSRDTEMMQEQRLKASQLQDAVSSTVEALKTLMESTGYQAQVAYIQMFGGWEKLISTEGYYEGVVLLARAMVVKDCWHNRPIFHILINNLNDLKDLRDYSFLMVLLFLTELLRSRAVASMLDEAAAAVIGKYFLCDDLIMAKLLMQLVEVIVEHKDMTRPFQVLQPYVLKCCYCSKNKALVWEVLRAVHRLIGGLSWQNHSSFLTQLPFLLEIFYEEESDVLRITAFETYRLVLTKVKGTVLVFPFQHQVINVVVIMVLHLLDESVSVKKICRPILIHTATILGWSKLKVLFAKKDVWEILGALLAQERRRALWFLKQSVDLFRSWQAPIRQGAVWFAGQIFQTLSEEESTQAHDSYVALRNMQEDSDPFVSCLATQTLYVLDVKEKLVPQNQPRWSCFCHQQP